MQGPQQFAICNAGQVLHVCQQPAPGRERANSERERYSQSSPSQPQPPPTIPSFPSGCLSESHLATTDECSKAWWRYLKSHIYALGT